MGHRASASGISLTAKDATIVKGMLARGDRQHDIAAWFGVNGGRIGEIATGVRFSSVAVALLEALPPPGPYPSGRVSLAALDALNAARNAIDAAERVVKQRIGSAKF